MKNIKLILFFIFLFTVLTPANALIITHPESDNETVEEDGIFFSGKTDRYEKVYINDVKMNPAKKGAFSYKFNLKEGENIFTVKSKKFLSKEKTKKFKIKRVLPPIIDAPFIEKEPSYYGTTKDNSILRSTPIDGGINRLGYLPKGTKVFVDGEQNGFLRVYLTKNQYGWIWKKDLTKEDCSDYTPQKILSNNRTENDKEITIITELSDNCPYSATAENNILTVKIFNLDTISETCLKEYKLDKFPRYSVCMQNNLLYITLKKNPIDKCFQNKDVTVVIDAGHGGSEPGAVGCLGDKEKDINLDVALKLKELLEENKFNVKMTRNSDSFVSLNDRVKFAQDQDALIFISIHLNSVPVSRDPNLNSGTIVFYYNPQSKKLADTLENNITEELHTFNGGISQASFAVIRPTEYIGVLVELAYMVNPQDVKIYKDKNFAKNSANAIYKGLVNYIHSELEN